MVKKNKNAEPQKPKQKERIKEVKHPLCQPNQKNFRFGNDVRPRIVKSKICPITKTKKNFNEKIKMSSSFSSIF